MRDVLVCVSVGGALVGQICLPGGSAMSNQITNQSSSQARHTHKKGSCIILTRTPVIIDPGMQMHAASGNKNSWISLINSQLGTGEKRNEIV